MSTLLNENFDWMGTVNTPLGKPIIVSPSSKMGDQLSRVRIGSAWGYLYSSYFATLTGMNISNPVLPSLLIALEGSPEIDENEMSSLSKKIREIAVESRSEDAAAEGAPVVSPLTEELSLKVAARLIAAECKPESVGVSGEGRIAFGWTNGNQALMITVGDNGRVRLSSRIGRNIETFGSWGVVEPIPSHYLKLLKENF